MNAYIEKSIILKKIEDEVLKMVSMIANGHLPSIQYSTNETISEVATSLPTQEVETKYRKSKLDVSSSIESFTRILHLLSVIHKLLLSGSVCTKREIYYRFKSFYKNQGNVDSTVNIIIRLLRVPRNLLNISATSKGLIAGYFKFIDEAGIIYSCQETTHGIQIPDNPTNIKILTDDLSNVLIVEKDSCFQSLLDDGFMRKFKDTLLITGKGYPDINTRKFVKFLQDNTQAKIYVLADADPHGIDIMCVYRFGSKSMVCEKDYMASSSIIWLGLYPSEIQRFNISETNVFKFTKQDESKCFSLVERPYIRGDTQLRDEVELMMINKAKAEIEALADIKDTFLLNIYLPMKL